MRILGDASEPGAGRGRVVHVRDIWRAVALSEGTFLQRREIGSWIFSEILYGGSWGWMRSPHKISGQSEVVWWVNSRFKKTPKVWRLLAEFHNLDFSITYLYLPIRLGVVWRDDAVVYSVLLQ